MNLAFCYQTTLNDISSSVFSVMWKEEKSFSKYSVNIFFANRASTDSVVAFLPQKFLPLFHYHPKLRCLC